MSPEVVDVRIAQHTFPDLTAYKDPDGVICYCSVAITPYVDRLDVKHDSEGRTYVTGFTVDKGVKIYSDPPLYYVGRYNDKGFGDIPEAGWQERLEQSGWDEEIVKRIKDYFRRHPAVDF